MQSFRSFALLLIESKTKYKNLYFSVDNHEIVNWACKNCGWQSLLLKGGRFLMTDGSGVDSGNWNYHNNSDENSSDISYFKIFTHVICIAGCDVHSKIFLIYCPNKDIVSDPCEAVIYVRRSLLSVFNSFLDTFVRKILSDDFLSKLTRRCLIISLYYCTKKKKIPSYSRSIGKPVI